MPERPRVLVISFSPVAEEMAGPAIRSLELARALRPHADVTLAAVEGEAPPPALDIELLTYRYRDPRGLREPIERADAIVCAPPSAILAGWMRHSRARLVFDLYDPEPLEALERHAEAPSRWRRIELDFTLDRLSLALHLGHHFVCASERQRDLWIGAMLGERLLSPEAVEADPSLRSVLDVVPFGLPAEPPAARGGGPRAALPELGPEDEVMLWNGGIWPWLDAPAAVEAAVLLAERRPRARLVFMAAADASGSGAPGEARARAEELGAAGRSVLFNEGWVPYEERAAWLLDADLAVATHRDHLETRFAFRTRVLDCLWARLPVVCTAGDELADRVERDGLGATVPPGDAAALAGAMESVLERGRDAYADALARAAEAYTWPRVVEPVARFVTAPGEPRRLAGGAGPRLATRARAGAYRAVQRAINATGAGPRKLRDGG
jgi:glycosyltransferase involved in cell wall biosynthesis